MERFYEVTPLTNCLDIASIISLCTLIYCAIIEYLLIYNYKLDYLIRNYSPFLPFRRSKIEKPSVRSIIEFWCFLVDRAIFSAEQLGEEIVSCLGEFLLVQSRLADCWRVDCVSIKYCVSLKSVKVRSICLHLEGNSSNIDVFAQSLEPSGISNEKHLHRLLEIRFMRLRYFRYIRKTHQASRNFD